MNIKILIFSIVIFLYSCKSHKTINNPNIILIMADDMGYECLSSDGNIGYTTPFLDSLASKGIRFTNCVSQPLCTPSRVKIMTGMYNYRNYDYFGHLNSEQYTFGNMMKEAGYSTCIAGKWQLNGLSYKNILPYWSDVTRPIKFGFEEYCLWQLTKTRAEGERYSNPLIEQNGKVLNTDENDYGPEIFSNFIIDFIERKKDVPFFIYYPMVLVHDPFVPTPDSDKWKDNTVRFENDTANFKEMVQYADKIVNKIVKKLRKLNIEENTLIIFTGDNGNHTSIYTKTKTGIIQGGKGNTINSGTHVPLIAYWPDQIKNGSVFDGLIEFSDFFPTFADVVKKEIKSDGKSFLPLLINSDYEPRKTAFVHYDPKWGENVNRYRNQFVRTTDYKLYQDGRFYNLKIDILEKNPLNYDSLSQNEKQIISDLKKELKNHPVFD